MRAMANPIPLEPPVISAAFSATVSSSLEMPQSRRAPYSVPHLRCRPCPASPSPLPPPYSLALALVAGCGGSDNGTGSRSRPAPRAAIFPSAKGKTLRQVVLASHAAQGPVASPAAAYFHVGTNRFPFGVFTTAHDPITDAQVAVYAAPAGEWTARRSAPSQRGSRT